MKKILLVLTLLFSCIAIAEDQVEYFDDWHVTTYKDSITDQQSVVLLSDNLLKSSIQQVGFIFSQGNVAAFIYLEPTVLDKEEKVIFRVDKLEIVDYKFIKAGNSQIGFPLLSNEAKEIFQYISKGKNNLYIRVDNKRNTIDANFSLKGLKKAFEYFKNKSEQL